MGLKWYIDSWAPIEGVAFFSRRETSVDPWRLEQVTTLMLQAPEFEPVQIDRSIAFGAVSRGFHERFAIANSEQEYGFCSLEVLIAFVRRIYLGGGPGSAGDDGPTDDGGPDSGPDNLAARFVELTPAAEELMQTYKRKQFNAFLNLPPEARFETIRTALDEFVYLRAKQILQQTWTTIGNSRRFWRIRSDAGDTWLPRQYAIPSGVPGKIRRFSDAMFFFAADRTVIGGLSQADALPLLLAISMYFSHPSADDFGYWFQDDWFEWHQQRSGYHAKYIVEWLPFDALPNELESTLQVWSLLDFKDQRGYTR